MVDLPASHQLGHHGWYIHDITDTSDDDNTNNNNNNNNHIRNNNNTESIKQATREHKRKRDREQEENTSDHDTVYIDDTIWQLTKGDLGYIPSTLTARLDKNQRIQLTKLVAHSRHALWKDYWIKTKAILKQMNDTDTTTTAAPGLPRSLPSPVGEPPPGPGLLAQPTQPGTMDQARGSKTKQIKLTAFFTKK
jgi:hypothetical protein